MGDRATIAHELADLGRRDVAQRDAQQGEYAGGEPRIPELVAEPRHRHNLGEPKQLSAL